MPEGSRPVDRRQVLCAHCANRLVRDIHETGNAYRQLEEALQATKTHGEKVSGRGELPMPIRLIVVEVRSQILHDLRWWCAWVARQRGLAARASPNNPAGMASWLATHVDWLARTDDVLVLRDIMATHRRMARALRDIPADRTRFPVGPCPEIVGGDEPGWCTGTVYAHIPAELDKPACLRCKGCGATWERGWARVGDRILRRVKWPAGAGSETT